MNTSKKVAITVGGLNLVSILFFSIVEFVNSENAIISTVLATLAFTVLCFDIIYAAFSRRLALTRIIVSVTAIILNFAFGILVGTSVFNDSFNIVGLLMLICAYLINAIIAVYSTFSKKDKKLSERTEKILKVTTVAIGTCGIIAIFIVGVIFISASTVANTNAVNLNNVMISLCVTFIAFVIYGLRDLKRKKSVLLVAFVVGVICIVPYDIIEGVSYRDVNQAERSFIQAFGDPEISEGLRSPYNYALEFIGIQTKNYTVERDKLYYEGDGIKENISLRYDVYYPVGERKGVLINLHGSGGDKDTGNYAHRNKYFASVGYTVFDIQYGDWNESGTGDIPIYDTTLEWAVSHLYHLDEFIKYASVNEKTADWSNMFLTGVSMGGTQISRYVLSYDNSIDETSAVLRGIIPIYPGYSSDDEGILNCLSYVTENSAPCLVFMGDKDEVVDPLGARRYKDAYSNAGNSLCASIYISYAGHGCDYFMAGRSNQMITYYMQKFMETFRK